MADNTIDTLELQLISDANKANASLDSLTKKLMSVSHSLNAINGGGLRKLSKDIGTVSAAIKAFSNTKIKMPQIDGATREVDRMEKYVSSASKRIADSLSNAFKIKGRDLAGIQKQIQEMGNMLVSGNTKEASDAFEPIGKSVIDAASKIRYVDDEMERFYQTVLKTNKIKVSPNLPKAMPDEWKNMDGLLRQKMSTQAGTELDSLMQEWKNNFKGLFSGLDVDTVENQFLTLNRVVKQCREGIEDPMAHSGLLEDAVWEKVYQDVAKLGSEIKNTKAVLESTGGTKETQALGLDKFIADLKKLSNINLDGLSDVGAQLTNFVDGISSLNGVSIDAQPIEQAISMLDGLGKKKNVSGTENLKQISSNLKEFAASVNSIGNLTTALRSLSDINFDSNNLSKAINSIKNLLSVKTEGFDTGALAKIHESIQNFSAIPDVSNSVNRLVSSLAKLAGAGSGIATVSDELPRLGESIGKASEKLLSVGNISGDLNTFIQSLSSLANAGNKAQQTASGLDVLAQKTLSFMQTMASAPAISNSTISMTQALARLSSAGNNVGASANLISNSFSRLNGTSKAASAAFRSISDAAGKAVTGIKKMMVSVGKLSIELFSPIKAAQRLGNVVSAAFQKIGNSSKHLNTASMSLKNLLRSFAPLMGIAGLFNLGKQSMELASDLTEVQNVVDTAFGNMSYKVDEFAETSIQKFGMAELAAKTYSSRFQAIGSAMGINSGAIQKANQFLEQQTNGYVNASNSMSDVSLNLTKLTADMASFYNVSQKDVADDLASIFTGQTMPLRQYGLDLTQATLQEWAMKQGLDANIASMSQAEKAMLRYQYVLANTTLAQGDFERTANSWHNLVETLKQSFGQLGSIVGGTLINAFKPLVKALNSVLQKVIAFAEMVSQALGKIFGWEIEISGGNIADDIGDASGAADDLADSAGGAAGGMGDAAGAADKLKKKLSVLPFDQLNQLSKDMSSAGSGGSGGGGGGGGGADSGEGVSASLVKTESIFDKFESEIDTLEELGAAIGDALKKAMDSIPWDEIYRKAENFGIGLADFLNGIIRTPGLFDSIGRTIAGALNTVLHALDGFGRTFDWTAFGKGLADGLNSLFDNFDFGLLASTIDTWINGLLDSLIAFAENAKWKEWGEKIGGFVKDALWGIDWNKAYQAADGFGSGLADFLNGLVEDPEVFSAVGTTLASTLNTALHLVDSFGNTFEWDNFGSSLATGLNNFIYRFDFNLLSDSISTWANGLLTAFEKFTGGLDWGTIGAKTAACIKKALLGINWGTAYQGASNFGSGLATFLNKLMTPGTFSAIGRTIARSLNTVISGAHSLLGGINWEQWGRSLGTGLNTFLSDFDWEGAGLAIKDFIDGFVRFLENAASTGNWGEFGQRVGELIADIPWMNYLQRAAKAIISILADFLKGLWGSGNVGKIAAGIGAAFLAIKVADITGISTLASMIIAHLVSRISKQEHINLLTDALKNVISPGATTAAEELGKVGTAGESAATKVGILKELLPALGFSGAIAGIAELAKKTQELTDKLNGGNGKLTEFGGAMDSIRTYFAPNVSQAIFDLKEEIEDAGGVTDDTKQKFIDFFTAQGVSPEALQTAFNDVAASVGFTAEQEEILKGIIEGVAQASENAAPKIESSGETTEQAYGRIRQAIIDLGDECGFYGEKSQVVLDALQQQQDSGNNAKDALKYLLEMYGNMEAGTGTLADALNNKLKGSFDNLQSSAQGASDKTGILGTKIGGLEGSSILSLVQLGLMNLMFGNLKSSSEGANSKIGDFSTTLLNLTTSILGLASEAEASASEIPAGTARGITNNAGLVEAAITNMTDDNIIAVFEKLLKIHSPSKVTEGHGKNTDQGFANGVTKNANLVKTAVSNLIKDNILKPFKDDLKADSASSVTEGYAKNLMQGFANGFTKNKTITTTAVTEVITAIKELFTKENENFKGFGATFMEKIGTGFTDKKGDAITAVTGVIDEVKTKFTDEYTNLNTIGAELMSNLISGIGAEEQNVSSKAGGIAKSIKSAIANEYGALKTIGTRLMSNLRSGMGDEKSSVSSKAGEIAKSVKSTIANEYGALKTIGGKLITNLKSGMGGQRSYAATTASGIADSIKGKFNFSLYSNGQSVIQSFIRGMQSVHIPTPHMTFTTSTSVNGGNATTSSSGRVNWYASGGVFKFPTVIGIGEAGKEAVLPLENKRTMSMIADSITQNSKGMGVDKELLTNAVAQGVAMAMMNNSSNRTTPQYIQNSIYLDGDVMARVVTEAQKNMDYRMNPTPAFG